MSFGKKLKELRMKKRHGLRAFAALFNMKVSDLSDIELGWVEPPQEEEWINEICNILQLEGKDKLELVGAHNEPFFMEMKTVNRTPIHGITSNDETAAEESLIALSEAIKQDALEHNAKAKEFNKRKKAEIKQQKDHEK